MPEDENSEAMPRRPTYFEILVAFLKGIARFLSHASGLMPFRGSRCYKLVIVLVRRLSKKKLPDASPENLARYQTLSVNLEELLKNCCYSK